MGYTCAGGVARPVACSAGGEYASGTGTTTCLTVPPGKYKKLEAGAEDPLFEIVSGAGVNSAVEQCPTGYACAGNAARPLKCHNAATVEASATCTNCLASTYPVGDEGAADAVCKLCEKGFKCADGTARVACSGAGVYAGETGTLACAPVPAGSYKKLTSGAFATVSGADVNSEVETCPVGYTCAGGVARPVACSAGGEYASGTGTTTCLTVPPGKYKKLEAGAEDPLFEIVSGAGVNSAVEQCPTGYACAGNAARPLKCHNAATVEASATCTNCLASTYPVGDEGAADAVCKLCEKGFKCADGTARVACSGAGVYAGETGTLACAPVPAGSYKKLTSGAVCDCLWC